MMKDFNFYSKSKLFFSKHSGALKVAGSICGAAIIVVSANNYVLSKDNVENSIVSESNSVPELELATRTMTVYADNADGYEEIQVSDYAVNVEMLDGTSKWISVCDLSSGDHTNLVSKLEVIGTKQETNGIDTGYKLVNVYEQSYLVYNEDGTKQFRTLSYLNNYVEDITTSKDAKNYKLVK